MRKPWTPPTRKSRKTEAAHEAAEEAEADDAEAAHEQAEDAADEADAAHEAAEADLEHAETALTGAGDHEGISPARRNISAAQRPNRRPQRGLRFQRPAAATDVGGRPHAAQRQAVRKGTTPRSGVRN